MQARDFFPGDVYVGVAPGYIEYVLPFASNAQYQNEAQIRVALMIAPEVVTFPALAKGELDLVITGAHARGHEHLECERVYNDRMFIVSGHDHPLTARGELLVSDLVGERWVVGSAAIRRQLCDIFEERKLPPPKIALVAASSTLRVSKVATSRLLGVHSVATLLALTEARTYLTILPVKDLVWTRPVMAAYKSARSLSAASRRLIEDMKAIAIRSAG
jgi:DNA-binding transcriptional LysR family regulator